MSSIWHTPKVQLVITLLLIFSVALMITAPSGKIFLLLASVGFATFFDLLFTFIRKRGVFFPYAAIVTGMIIALIIDPNAFWYQIAVVSAIAMGTKNFLRVTGRHVFNPAAIGLLIGGILFHQYAAWWGVSFQKPVVFILLLPALISGIRLRRLPTIITFLIANILFTQQPFLSRIFDPVTLFFATVMLPEPMTTPFNPKRQILYGLTVAVIIQQIPYIPALLLGNILFLKYNANIRLMTKLYFSIIAFIILAGTGLFILKTKSDQATKPLAIAIKQEAVVENTITIEGGDYYLKPGEIRVKKDQKVKIVFKNTKGFHDLVIDEFSAWTPQILEGNEAEVTFTPDKIGTFEFYCSVGGHRGLGMKGKLIVE